MNNLKDSIRAKALELGFDVVGFAAATADPQWGEALHAWLADGRHGDMAWMEEKAARRTSPAALWDGVRSVVVLGTNYGPAGDPLALLDHAERGNVSVYARNKDYHDLVKKRLKALARWMVATHGGDLKVFVDTAPVMEKPLAERGGLGWQGRHTNLVSRRWGSWLFLSEVFTTLDLPPDPPETDHCGTCRACVAACPTGAIGEDGRIDARRCISYLTIEHKDHIAEDLRSLMGNRIYGCDDCLAACPWNKFASATAEPDFLPRAELTAPRLADLAALDDESFRAVFAGSPLKRIGRDRLVRNVLIAIGNSGRHELLPAVERVLGDASPLVRAMAVWALGRLNADRALQMARTYLSVEDDPRVQAEWQRIATR
jgi:epoxyqueuosine reductase